MNNKFKIVTGFTEEEFLELYLAGILKIESSTDLKAIKIMLKYKSVEEIKKIICVP